MYPDEILGLFHLYGLMIGIGILCCFLMFFYYGKKRKMDGSFIDFVFYNAILSIVFGFFAAALFQATYNYIENPEKGFELGEGITFIGGLIGGVAIFLAVYFILRKKLKGRVLDILSYAPACITIAHAFGRIGCLFAGCCHGARTDAWYGIHMHTSEFGYAKVVPTQLFEALFLFALCAVIFILVMKWDFKHGMSVYLIAYGLFRFGIEYARSDDRGALVWGISPSQFWSILMVALGIGLIFFVDYFWKKRKAEQEKQEIESVETQEQQEE